VNEGECVDKVVKTITRTWSAPDGCDGTATCTQTITVKDTEAPELQGCPDPDGGSYQCLDDVPAPPTVTASDNCDTDVQVDFNEHQSNPGSNCNNTITRTWTATDDCGNEASCTQTITVNDDTKPTVDCPDDITVNLEPGDACPPTVEFTATGSDNCDPNPTIVCDPPSGSEFPIGTTTVTCTATDACGNVSDECSFTVTVNSAVCAVKFYDANANGEDDDGQVVEGFKMVLSGAASATQYTGSDGKTCFTELAAGDYTVTEVLPSGWVATTATSQDVTLGCPQTVKFGNVCLGAGGGKTLGFWSNKNGQNQMNDGGSAAPELAMLSGLCLRNADGTNFDPATYSAFRTWILNATAVNMAYMLSAQLAAMELNVEAGFVSGGSLVYAPGCGNTGVGNNFISISDLMTAANDALCADGYTPDGDPNRATQECLKNALDKANNNLNFVQSTPCSFTSPY
jgi:hypothetical protein